jgi:hypothetical protein
MKVTFEYSKVKDVWCLFNKGKTSINNPNPTKVYEQMVAVYGENPTEEIVSAFIDKYLLEHNISVQSYCDRYSEDWGRVADTFYKKAETVFGVVLSQDVTAYLTVNNRNPYSVTENMFYVTVPRDTVRKTIMHELWHFYTWYAFGVEQEEKLGMQTYNDIKVALTVLLNVECADLMPGVVDAGYPQHQELRANILKLWLETKDIHTVWNACVEAVNVVE